MVKIKVDRTNVAAGIINNKTDVNVVLLHSKCYNSRPGNIPVSAASHARNNAGFCDDFCSIGCF